MNRAIRWFLTLREGTHAAVGAFAAVYWTDFVCGFCYRLPLLITLLLLTGLVTGRVGGEFGVTHLIRHEKDWKCLVVGFGLAATVLECLLISFLLASVGGSKDAPAGRVGFWRYAAGVLLCFTTTVLGVYLALKLVRFLPSLFGAEVFVQSQGALTTDGLPWWQLDAFTLSRWLILAAGGGLCLLVTWVLSVAIDKLWSALAKSWPAIWAGRAWAGHVRGRWQRRVESRSGPTVRFEDEVERPRYWFVLLALTLLFTAYVAVAWAFSRLDSNELRARVGVVIAATVALPLLLACLAPVSFTWALRVLSRDINLPERAEYPYHRAAVFYAFFGTGMLFLFSWCPHTRSPALPALFALTTGLAAYGLCLYLAHRRVALALAGLAVMALVGGLPAYKFRFGDLGERDGFVEAARVDYYAQGSGHLADLDGLARGDIRDQEKIDRILYAARDNDAEYREVIREMNELWQTHKELYRSAPAVRGQWECLQGRLNDIEERLGVRKSILDPAVGRVVPVKDYRPEARLPASGEDPKRLLALEEFTTDAHAKERPLVLVAVSGGGMRSAAWTFAVLAELELRFAEVGKDLPGHVRLINGASGGMLGAAAYVTTLPPLADRTPEKLMNPVRLAARRDFLKGRYDKLTQDCLTPVMNRWVYNDLPAAFSPFPVERDRGEALQEAWASFFRTKERDGSWLGEAGPERGSLEVTFDQLRAAELKGVIPSLVFSPMMVEDGRRLLVSNLDLRYVASNDGNMLGTPDPGQPPWATRNVSNDGLELFRLFPGSQRQVRLSTAVRMSASFPYFSPPAVLPTVPRRRVVDAGYYDNYGVSLAASWLFSGKNAEWLDRHASKILLVQVRDGSTHDQRRLRQFPPSDSTELSRAGEEVTTPLEGIFNARVGSSSFRNDGQIELLSAYLRDRRQKSVAQKKKLADVLLGRFAVSMRMRTRLLIGPALDQPHDSTPLNPLKQSEQYFTNALFEYEGSASLSWYLTEVEREAIWLRATARRTDDNPTTCVERLVPHLVTWWNAP